MTVLIVFSTIEGQTGKIARFVEDEVKASGRTALMIDADDMDVPDFDDVEAVILAAPVHERRHPRAFEAFLIAHEAELAACKTLFLSVSLNAAFPEGMEEAQEYVTEMNMRTKLTPDATMLVPGAVRGGAYDYYSKQVLAHVVLRDREFDPNGVDVYEFTDWDLLRGKVEGFLNG